MRRLIVALGATLVSVPACSSADGGAATTTQAATTTEVLPAPCVTAPFTVVVERDGERPAGSAAYDVLGAAVLPIPLVPDRDEALDLDEAQQLAETTDLLMYSIVFGDEAIEPEELSVFGGYEPTEDHTRGFVSIMPSAPGQPLAEGDVVTPGPASALKMFTVLNVIGMDFKDKPGDQTAYLEQPVGSVTILALTDSMMCVDVDLTWKYSDFGPDSLGSLTIDGVFSGPIAPREKYPFE
jgi:hypothetical protein